MLFVWKTISAHTQFILKLVKLGCSFEVSQWKSCKNQGKIWRVKLNTLDLWLKMFALDKRGREKRTKGQVGGVWLHMLRRFLVYTGFLCNTSQSCPGGYGELSQMFRVNLMVANRFLEWVGGKNLMLISIIYFYLDIIFSLHIRTIQEVPWKAAIIYSGQDERKKKGGIFLQSWHRLAPV